MLQHKMCYILSSSRRNWMDYAQKDEAKDRKTMLSTLSTTRFSGRMGNLVLLSSFLLVIVIASAGACTKKVTVTTFETYKKEVDGRINALQKQIDDLKKNCRCADVVQKSAEEDAPTPKPTPRPTPRPTTAAHKTAAPTTAFRKTAAPIVAVRTTERPATPSPTKPSPPTTPKPLCPAGWGSFKRSDGRIWCMSVSDEQKKHSEAQTTCQEQGANLNGFESPEEYNAIRNFLKSKGVTKQVHLGATRVEGCTGRDDNPYNQDPKSPCSRDNVFAWENKVSTKNSIGPHWTDNPSNPSNNENHENCLTLMPEGEDPQKLLNDAACSSKFKFMCGKYSAR
ncbi:unnamed protein product [Caenorhabditis auriculariae]|uniref:C-type lectin domain-containing protein n=1 Tax=Caenorhabditis auriculariae TaxID=2777116 RepID=A0A8S1H2M6_9PELO|nr:unnamed protein product [Caenorhabditis auriculariae]